MKSIQDYFDTHFKKNSVFIKGGNLEEKLEGDSLIVKDFPNLESLDIEKWEQVKNITFENCPKLRNITCANKHMEPVVVVPPKETDWLCIIGFTCGIIAIVIHVYRWFDKRRNEDKKEEKEKR